MTKKKQRAILARALKPTGLPLPVRMVLARRFLREGTVYGYGLGKTEREKEADRAVHVPAFGCGSHCCGVNYSAAYVDGPKGAVEMSDLRAALLPKPRMKPEDLLGLPFRDPPLVQLARQAAPAVDLDAEAAHYAAPA